ncbi:hypothetical protein [Lentzea sp. E54]|uniref:hypothetical protein n=1 Tax=Lentzea xerophila TaxID=3435883 RepID=UPI003DA55624
MLVRLTYLAVTHAFAAMWLLRMTIVRRTSRFSRYAINSRSCAGNSEISVHG